MKKTLAASALAGLLAGGVIGCSAETPGNTVESAAPPPPMTADAAPHAETLIDFSMQGLDGQVRSLSEWRGKGQLVNFWATWCAPCRREIPLLKATQEEHGANGVQVIGIAVDDMEPVQVYAEETAFNYPILVGQDEAIEAAEAAGVGFIGLPFTIIVAPGGQLLKTHTGEIHQEHIDRIVGVFAALDQGDMDLAGARLALEDL